MPSARTTLTEIATALGCLDLPTLDWAILQRPAIAGVTPTDWEQIDAELPRSRKTAEAAFENGRHLRAHDDGLRGRAPALVEWTGGRQPPGDQAIPADLRLDHVYLVSCKYLSKILLNTAPSRLFGALLQPAAPHRRDDWYELVAPDEHRALAVAATRWFELEPPSVGQWLDLDVRHRLKTAFGRHAKLTGQVGEAYAALCTAVSEGSAERWRSSLSGGGRVAAENVLWRLLRLASATYYVLGVGPRGDSLRLRVMTPWDWRQAFELLDFDIEPAGAGQPQVTWAATVRDRDADVERMVHGHVEVRWSHGRFGGPPEAKVYLDTPHAEVPGYVPLT